MPPTVSIVTATYNRHSQLRTAIQSIQNQTFPDWEHIIVADGPDPELPACMPDDPRVHLFQLGRHQTKQHLPGSVPMKIGTYFTQGRYIAYLDDDNEWYPQHLERLIDRIKAQDCDFVYSKCEIFRHGAHTNDVVGSDPPSYTHIDTSLLLHKHELLSIANWEPGEYAHDAVLVARWLNAGAKYSFVDEITMRYNAWR